MEALQITQPIIITGYVIIIDIVLGTLRALVKGNFTSSEGRKGFVSHVTMFLCLLLTFYVAQITNTAQLANNIIMVVFIANYVTSIIANLEELGFPVPQWVKSLISAEIEKKRAKK